MVMIDPERIQRLAAKMGNRKDALEFVRQMRCGGKKFYEGGDKDAAYIYKPKNAEIPVEVIPLGSPYLLAKYRVYDDGTVYIPGLSKVDQDIKDGAYWMYGPIASKKTYLRNKDNGEYFEYDPDINPSLNLSGYDKVGYDEIKPMLPRRDYIGGDNYRLNTVKRVPGLLDMIKRKADSYGLDPNLLLHRFMKEGIVDYWVNRYNTENAVDQNDSFFKNLLNEEVDGFNGLGLDDAGSNLLSGKYTLKDPSATWQERTARNEEGRDVVSIVSPDMNSALEIKAAEMAYRQRELAKRGLTGNAYVNAAYNMGLNHDKLNDPDYVSRNYTVPDYHVFDGGGKFFRTNLQNESPLMYQPILPSYPDVPTPMRYEPQPHLGLYEYPASTGMAESYPVTLPPRVPVAFSQSVSAPVVAEEGPVSDLFSDDAKARRLLRQRYAESVFDDKAVSNAGARGAWQIMPITYKDYLTRGKGKEGDLDDPDFNRLVRDHTFRMIPRDLEEIWDENYSDRNKLALLYAGYNRGANGLKKYLRGLVKKGVDISKPENWVEGMNPKTRNYVHFLAYDEDVPGTYLMNEKFEKAARKRGYMAEGGRLFRNGGPGDKKQNWFTRATLGAMMADSPAVAQASGWTHSNNGDIVQTEQDSEGAKKLRAALAEIAAMPLTDLAVDVAGAAVVGTRTYKAMRLAREMNRALKSGEYDAAIEMARKASSDSPKNISHIVSLSPRNNLVELTEPSTIRLTPDDIRYMNYDFGSGTGYSGYTPTNQSADAARFVQDVNEGVTWGLNRGKLKPSSSVDMSGSIGEHIGGGGEASVFADANDGGRVLKVLADDTPFEDRLGNVGNLMRDNVIFYDTPADAVSAAERFVSEKNMRPYNIVQNVEGYIPSKTTPGKYHPVISQARVRGGMPSVEQMGKFEDPFFRRNNILNEYDMPEWYDLDLEPFNVGELPNGVLMGIDLKKDGGRIHIKPENRGKFTALKKRTGHSASWFKAHGTPAQKKMAVFALNSKHWSHKRADGGYLQDYGQSYELGGVYDYPKNRFGN